MTKSLRVVFFCPEHEESMFPRNIVTNSPDYIVPHQILPLRKPQFPLYCVFDSQILNFRISEDL